MGSAHAAAYYGGANLLPSMLLVAVGTVAGELAAGRDAPDVTDWHFWDRVFWRTVSLGFFQDLATGLIESQSPSDFAARVMGPTAQAIYTPIVAVGGVVGEIPSALGLAEDRHDTTRDVIAAVKNFVPRTMFTDLIVNRKIWDNISEWADPEAHADFRRQVRAAQRNGRTGYWWAPGTDNPQRGPDLSDLDLQDNDHEMSLGN